MKVGSLIAAVVIAFIGLVFLPIGLDEMQMKEYEGVAYVDRNALEDILDADVDGTLVTLNIEDGLYELLYNFDSRKTISNLEYSRPWTRFILFGLSMGMFSVALVMLVSAFIPSRKKSDV